MHITTRNVNTAFHGLVKLFNGEKYAVTDSPGPAIVKRSSRNGPVMMIDEPVMITYTHPRERVLFNQARDANPFFHLYEALWMLAGRNDVASLAYYTSKMAQFSDDGKTFNGAYGYRWRHARGFRYDQDAFGRETGGENDQLDIIVNHLKADHNSRRAVLSMWNVEDDLLKIGSNVANQPVIDTDAASKDVCCNLNVMFSIREVEKAFDTGLERTDSVGLPAPLYEFVPVRYLDMTVTNRSNDMIWGMLGANVVHFSFLQEYMAAQIGVEVGRYTQMTNNLHVYESNWKPDEWLSHETAKFDYTNPNLSLFHRVDVRAWGRDFTDHISIVKNSDTFNEELPRFVEQHKELGDIGEWEEPFFRDVAGPMLVAFHWHKKRCYEFALEVLTKCKADDWRIVGTNWITKRMENHDRK